MLRHRFDHDRACSNQRTTPNGNISQYLSARPDNDIISECGMTFPPFLTSSSQGHTLVERDIVTNDSGLADHHSHPMVDEKTFSNLSAWMNLNTGKPPR